MKMQRKATIAVMLVMVMAVCATGAAARLLDAQAQAPAAEPEAPALVPCDETVHRGCAACRRAQGEGASEGGLVCVACTENAYLNERGACVCDPGYGYRYSPAYCSKCPRISEVPEVPGSGSSYFCNQATSLWEPRPAK